MNHDTYPLSSAPAAGPHLPGPGALPRQDPLHGLHRRLRECAAGVALREPLLRPMLQALVLVPATAAEVVATVLARRLGGRDLPETVLARLFQQILDAHPQVGTAIAADIGAIEKRDPACPDCLHALLNLRGLHALLAYRMAHATWQDGRRELAHALSAHAAAAFAVDIHPAARLGSAIMLDHGTGIVIGETAVVEDAVSILQDVTLGGTGKHDGDRHPKVRSGVMIGAGAKIIGNIEIGTMSKVAAGSVVLADVPPHCTVAGIPARVVRRHPLPWRPALEMDQAL